MQIFANTDPGWESTKIPAVLDFPVRLASPTNKNFHSWIPQSHWTVSNSCLFRVCADSSDLVPMKSSEILFVMI